LPGLLYLSSYRLGSDPAAIVASRAGARAGLVFNAHDGYVDRLRTWDDECADITALGYACEELDLRDYWAAAPGELAQTLARLDLVWVVGGNTFVLAKAMTLAGFGPALGTARQHSDLVYGGYSAGSCVVGPDLVGIDLMDEPDLIPDGYPADAEALCLALVPFRIVPHVDSDHEESGLAAIALAHLAETGLAFRPLRDGQALVVRDGDVSVAGDPARRR
jgi:dipeptidase E